jgi:carboxyl-terminal processing protease
MIPYFLYKNKKLLITTVLLGFLLLVPLDSKNHLGTFQTVTEAGFFDNELNLFEEVIDLVGDKYFYTPNYKKLLSASIEEMVKSLDNENIIFKGTPDLQSISKHATTIEYKLDYNREKSIETFKKVFYFLSEDFKENLAKEKLEIAAVTGLMNSLDSHSQYMDADSFIRSMRDTEGKYGGLGMVVSLKDNIPYVVKTIKNSPAQRAGILPGDVFKKIDGVSTEKVQISELADMIRGQPNTNVIISLYRPSDKRVISYSLNREIIAIETVEYQMLENNIGAIKINSFSKQTNNQLKEALLKAKQDKVQAFILDLRNNPGGLLDQSVKVASHFLYQNRLVVYTQGRKATDKVEYRAKYKNRLHSIPVVILINQNSASAAEIVAGALRDSGKALIIGENSYGKGTVQTIFRTSDGSGLRLTTSKYYTPSGIDITAHGITPEIHIIKNYAKTNSLSLSKKPKATPLKINNNSLIELEETQINNFVKKNYTAMTEASDPTFQFAKILIKNISVANKKKTLEKARELAANIHY